MDLTAFAHDSGVLYRYLWHVFFNPIAAVLERELLVPAVLQACTALDACYGTAFDERGAQHLADLHRQTIGRLFGGRSEERGLCRLGIERATVEDVGAYAGFVQALCDEARPALAAGPWAPAAACS